MPLDDTHSEVIELILVDSHFLLKFITPSIEMIDIPELGMFFLVALDFLRSKSELGLTEKSGSP